MSMAVHRRLRDRCLIVNAFLKNEHQDNRRFLVNGENGSATLAQSCAMKSTVRMIEVLRRL